MHKALLLAVFLLATIVSLWNGFYFVAWNNPMMAVVNGGLALLLIATKIVIFVKP